MAWLSGFAPGHGLGHRDAGHMAMYTNLQEYIHAFPCSQEYLATS